MREAIKPVYTLVFLFEKDFTLGGIILNHEKQQEP